MSGPEDGARERVARWLAENLPTPYSDGGRSVRLMADELLSVVADTTAGEAEIERAARLLYPGHFPDYALRLHPEQILRVASALAARSGGAQDDGLREALVGTLVREGVWPLAVAERAADALLPVVLRYGRDKAAEELRAVARSLPPTEDRTANRIHDRADALTALDPA